MIMLFLVLFLQSTDPRIELVKNEYLDIDQRWPVGQAFEAYPFFESVEWRMQGRNLVVFEGFIDDAVTVEAYKEDHEWSWRENFKAIQLESTYQLDDDKDKLSFIFHFRLDGEGGFSVEKGFLGVRSKKTSQWKQVRLDTKPIVKVMKGIYLKQNPYMSLIQGLPFK